MTGQWEEWGTSPAHQNMESLLLRLAFRGESGIFKVAFLLKINGPFLVFASGHSRTKNRFVKEECFSKWLKTWEQIWWYEFGNRPQKPRGCISFLSSLHLSALMSSFDSIICVSTDIFDFALCAANRASLNWWLTRVWVVKREAQGPLPAWLLCLMFHLVMSQMPSSLLWNIDYG